MPQGPPQQIVLIRHAEKPSPLGPGPASGITEDGRLDPHALVPRGWQRAGALAHFFCTAEGDIGKPTHLFAPPASGKPGDHGRPNQTITPLAAKLGIAIDAGHVLDAEADLVTQVLQRDGVVLIAWEHKRIPRIANAILGDATTAPQQWPQERFDVIWVFDRDPASGRYGFRQRPQLVLGGDSPEVITFG
jgi:broad specificity phosphatase PhoE